MKSITITSLSSTGEGVGTLDGLKIFVDGALPGETVAIAPSLVKKNYGVAKLDRILVPSPERSSPICPVFGECGGCQLMHLTYEGQLLAKRERVISAFKRIGGLQAQVAPCRPSPKPLAYRNKIQLPILWENGSKRVGFFRKNTHDIIPIKQCHIQCPQGEAILAKLIPLIDDSSIRNILIRNSLRHDENLVVLVSTHTSHQKLAERICRDIPEVTGVVVNLNRRRDNVILGPTFVSLAGRPSIHETLLGKRFRISAPSFFQVNPLQAEQLVAEAVDLAKITSSQRVVDAYCGVGVLALFAAERAGEVLGIECVPHAIADAKENARQNDATNCRFICGKAEEKLGKADVVFLNPPRKGCERQLLNKVLETRPGTVIYISCDPATLARDLALLCAGGYSIDEAIPFDMFPQTMHVETLVNLRL